MSIKSYKIITIILVSIIILLSIIIWRLNWKNVFYRWEVRDLWLAIKDYDRTRNHFDDMRLDDLIFYLDVYSRSNNSSQFNNESIEFIWQYEKNRIVKDIIQCLRKKTGMDLGEDPKIWLEKYQTNFIKYQDYNKSKKSTN
ncbi:MAG TPA: hypothetical protein PLW02_13860 [Verrucomicrobiota bacterium]|nr:hypothetical protein [Verrucomicrobiota bacterium]